MLRRGRHVCTLLWLLAACAALAGSAHAQDTVVAREQHAWGRFTVDSWKRVRVTTETLNENGEVVSTSTNETTTTLMERSDDSVTLLCEVTVEVAGKRFAAQPQIVQQRFSGQAEGQRVELKQLGDGTVTINGEEVPTEIRQVTVVGQASRRVSTIHYCGRRAPYVLRRDTVSTDATGEKVNYEMHVEVMAQQMPFRVLADVKPVAYVKTVHKNAKNTKITIEAHCADVPGGVVSHTSKETDAQGRIVRRSTLELVDYGIGPPEGTRASKVSNRRTWRRARQPGIRGR